MKELNLHIMTNSYLGSFCGSVVSLINKSEINELKALNLFMDFEALSESFNKVCYVSQSNQHTPKLQAADRLLCDCYKALYYALKSHLYLPEAEEKEYANWFIGMFKHTPRKLERMRQYARINAVNLLIDWVENKENDARIAKLGIERWLITLKQAIEDFETIHQIHYSEDSRKNRDGTSTKYRPELIVAMNNLFQYLDAYCRIHPNDSIQELKSLIETEFTDIRTICRRNATRRKNK